MTQAAVFYTFL